MEIYLVGGAVRDQLLGLPVKEKDWVVVGATQDEMLKRGFRQVGKDFPVFLHPKTHEEYALARVERKIGRGYTGFNFDTSPKVTLEEDLLRRDLTINAIAISADGSHTVDPYHGKNDLEKKLLRHVSPAFVEDPVRILRVGRFAARFAQYGFTVAPETIDLMKNMVTSGEVDALVAERVWKELERALAEKNPEQFFQVLTDCDAMPVLFPDIKKSNIEKLQQAATLSNDKEIRFAVLLYGLTPDQIKKLCDRYRVPSTYRELALLVAQYSDNSLKAKKLSASELLNLFQVTDAYRREERFKKFLVASELIATTPVSMQWLIELYDAVKTIDLSSTVSLNLKGKEIGDYINQERLILIDKFIKK